jgi:lysophospholipase L1-like esterase
MNKILKYFFNLLLIFSFIFFLFIYYRAEIYWNGGKTNYYLYYYIFSVLLLIISLLSYFISNELKKYLMIILISSFFSLFIFEYYLVFLNKNITNTLKYEIYKKETGLEFDKRSRMQIYKDLKKKDKNIKVKVSPARFYGQDNKIFPLSGVSFSNTIYCNENGYYSIYQSDRYGFNNPDEEWNKKKIDFLLIGDSFVHGACVNRPNDIGSVLRKLSNSAVLNLGYSSNGPLIELATLKEYLDKRVKNVIWFFVEGNDLDNLKDNLSNKILKNYYSNNSFKQNLKDKQEKIDLLVNSMINNSEIEYEKRNNKKKNILNKKLISFIKLSKTRNLLRNQRKQNYALVEFENIIENVITITKKNNSNLYFVYLPDYSRYKNKTNYPFYKNIKNMINRKNIKFIDIHEQFFLKQNNPLDYFPFGEHGHYNQDGYREITKVIFKSIKSDNLNE